MYTFNIKTQPVHLVLALVFCGKNGLLHKYLGNPSCIPTFTNAKLILIYHTDVEKS